MIYKKKQTEKCKPLECHQSAIKVPSKCRQSAVPIHPVKIPNHDRINRAGKHTVFKKQIGLGDSRKTNPKNNKL